MFQKSLEPPCDLRDEGIVRGTRRRRLLVGECGEIWFFSLHVIESVRYEARKELGGGVW
jgi:hypothetical protein